LAIGRSVFSGGTDRGIAELPSEKKQRSESDIFGEVVLKGPASSGAEVDRLPGGVAGVLPDAPLRFACADRLCNRARAKGVSRARFRVVPGALGVALEDRRNILGSHSRRASRLPSVEPPEDVALKGPVDLPVGRLKPLPKRRHGAGLLVRAVGQAFDQAFRFLIGLPLANVDVYALALNELDILGRESNQFASAQRARPSDKEEGPVP